MKEAMKVSILSSVMNEGKHLSEMIRSVQNQTHVNWELIFVDDGSIDSTAKIIAREADLDSRIRLIYTGPNRGLNISFNHCFESSTGDIIILLAGDDVLPPDSLAARVEFMSRFENPALAAGFFKLRTMSDSPKHDALVLPRGESGSQSGGVVTLGRELANRLFPIDTALDSEDPWLSLALRAIPGERASSPEIVLHYRIHDGNSNPRALDHARMRKQAIRTNQAYESVLNDPRFEISDEYALHLKANIRAADAAAARNLRGVFAEGELSWGDRASHAMVASPLLWAVRSKFFRLFSGLRGA